jgi:hypothetical protein
VDYVPCWGADCSSYTVQSVPGSWDGPPISPGSLNLGPNGFVDMIAMNASGSKSKIKPRRVKMFLRFNEPRNKSDHLSFMQTDNNECQESLGFAPCQTWGDGSWRWNVEIEADVSDDASQWTFTQKAGLSGSGTYGGAAYSFTDNVPFAPDPGILPVQQTLGTNTVFVIDGPGRSIRYKPLSPYFINTVTDIFDFYSKVCPKKDPKNCRRVWWYFKLIVIGGSYDEVDANYGNK